MPWLFLTKRSEQKTTSKSAKKSESPETGFVATENKKNKKKHCQRKEETSHRFQFVHLPYSPMKVDPSLYPAKVFSSIDVSQKYTLPDPDMLAPQNGWLEYPRFLFGAWPIFRGVCC